MIYFLVFLFGILGSILQCTLLRSYLPPYFVPDPILLLVLYGSLSFPLGRGLAMSFALGLLADLMSGAPEGWNAMFAMTIFLLNKGIQARIYLKHSPTAFGLFTLDLALKLPYIVFVKTLLGFPHPPVRAYAFLWLGEFFSTLLLMPVLFYLLSKSMGNPGTRFLKTHKPHTA